MKEEKRLEVLEDKQNKMLANATKLTREQLAELKATEVEIKDLTAFINAKSETDKI